MKLFRADPDDSLRAAQHALAQTEIQIVELTAERERTVSEEEGDYAAAVAKIDRQLLALRANVGIHRDRIAILEQRVRDAERERRAAAKVKAMAARKETIKPWRAAAARVDAAVAELSAAVAALDDAEMAVFANWPDVLPSAYDVSFLRIRDAGPLSRRRMERFSAGIVRELSLRDPDQFAATVDKNAAELLERLDAAPVPDASEIAA